MTFDFINSTEIVPNPETVETGNMDTGKISVSSISPYNEIINQLISESPEEVTSEKTEEAKDLLTKADFFAFMEKYQINVTSLERAFNPEKTQAISEEIMKFLEGLKNKETVVEKNNSIKEFIESNISKAEISEFYKEKAKEKVESFVKGEGQVVSTAPLIIEKKTEISSVISPTPEAQVQATTEETKKNIEEVTNSVTIVSKQQEVEKKKEETKKAELSEIIKTQNKELEKTKQVLSTLIDTQNKKTETNIAAKTTETTSAITTQNTVLGTEITPTAAEPESPKTESERKEILANLKKSTAVLDTMLTGAIKEGLTNNVNKTETRETTTNTYTQQTTNTAGNIVENKMETSSIQNNLADSSTIQNTQTKVKSSVSAPATSSTSVVQSAVTPSSSEPAIFSAQKEATFTPSTPSPSSEKSSVSLDALEKTMSEMLEIQKQLATNMQIVAATLQSPLMIIDTGRTQF